MIQQKKRQQQQHKQEHQHEREQQQISEVRQNVFAAQKDKGKWEMTVQQHRSIGSIGESRKCSKDMEMFEITFGI